MIFVVPRIAGKALVDELCSDSVELQDAINLLRRLEHARSLQRKGRGRLCSLVILGTAVTKVEICYL